MKVFEKRSFVLADPVVGGYWHAVPKSASGLDAYETIRANSPDGPEMARDQNSAYAKWLHSEVRATEIHALRKPQRELSHYALRPEFGATEANPSRLTPDQGNARLDNTATGDLMAYEAVFTQPEGGEWEVWPVTEHDLEGPRWPEETRGTQLSWTAEHGTGVDSRFHHLLPGKLSGVRASITKELHGRRNVNCYDHSEWSLYVRIPRPLAPKPKKGPGSRTQPKQTYRTVEIEGVAPPRVIAGESLADAIAKYRVLRDDLIAKVEAVTMCNCCDGKGWVS